MSSGCTCDPCTYAHSPWEPFGAGCCWGTGIDSYDFDCPVPEHAELAIKQHGPRSQRGDQA